MDSISILSWNIRGASNVLNKLNVKTVVMDSKPIVLCLQETKTQVWSEFLVHTLGMGSRVDWTEAKPVGLLGGLLTVWNSEEIVINERLINRHWILVSGHCKGSNAAFACFNIYAPQKLNQKKQLWWELSQKIDLLLDTPTILIGDFNSILFQSERENCAYKEADVRAFSSFISENELFSIQLINSSYTWYGPESKKSCLDRALINSKWMEIGEWQAIALQRKNSDHRPILVKNSLIDWGPRPFKFFNHWLEKESFIQKMKLVWEDCKEMTIHSKTKKLKEHVRLWNNSYNGDISTRIRDIEKEQEDADKSNVNDLMKAKIRSRLNELYSDRRSMLCQKARINWQLKGEKNTRFFHRAILRRRKSNNISCLRTSAGWTSSPTDIKNLIFNHFASFLGLKPSKPVFYLPDGLVKKLTPAMREDLIKPFTVQEAEAALYATESNKAPGPDGMNAGVLKAIWQSYQKDFLKFLSGFFTAGIIPPGINSSFIVLIPKKDNACSPIDFRPISLMNASMKLLSKILALRLGKFMHHLVSESQSAFISTRQMSDCILITSEVYAALKANKSKGLIIKLDFAKAFDTVCWQFALQVLERMNFDKKMGELDSDNS